MFDFGIGKATQWKKGRPSPNPDRYAAQEIPERHSTNDAYRSYIEKHIRPKWCDWTLRKLTSRGASFTIEQQHKPVPLVNRGRLAPGFIERELRAASANPYIAVMGTDAINGGGDVDPHIEAWPSPVLIDVHGNWLGEMSSQPIVSGGHAPATPLTLADQTDAIVYIAHCSALKSVDDSPAELDGTAYGREIIRRNIIEVGRAIPFRYGESPECVQATRHRSNLPNTKGSHDR